MIADFAKLTAGLLLAQQAPAIDEQLVQYGLVGLIAWMVIRECFSLVRMLLDRKAKKGACNDHDEPVRQRVEPEAMKDRGSRMEQDE